MQRNKPEPATFNLSNNKQTVTNMNTIFTITLLAATLLIMLAMIVGNIFLCAVAMSAYFLASAALYAHNKQTNKK